MTMVRSRYYRSLTIILLILLQIALERTEASPLSETSTQQQKRFAKLDLDRHGNTKGRRVFPTSTTDEKPTRKRAVVISDSTSTLTVGAGSPGVVINNGGGDGAAGSNTDTGPGGLTTANKITIGLAVPGAIAGIVGLIVSWRKYRDRQKK